jgi:hypothetical protein
MVLIFGACILFRPLLQPVWGCRQSQQFLFPYSPFHFTTCLGLCRPSSDEKKTTVCISLEDGIQRPKHVVM